MSLIVEGRDHGRARASPFGDIAVVGVRAEVEAKRDARLAKAFGIASPPVRNSAKAGLVEKIFQAFAVVHDEQRIDNLGVG
ncbi:MAG: hypothetical protein AB7N65_12175, partial [Vicinamibacterales bacterium]